MHQTQPRQYSATYILQLSDGSKYVQTNIGGNFYLNEIIISYNLPCKTSNGPKSPITFRVDALFWVTNVPHQGMLSCSWKTSRVWRSVFDSHHHENVGSVYLLEIDIFIIEHVAKDNHHTAWVVRYIHNSCTHVLLNFKSKVC